MGSGAVRIRIQGGVAIPRFFLLFGYCKNALDSVKYILE